MSADVIVMHPRRWGYLAARLDSQNRPLFQPLIASAQNIMGVGALAPMDMAMAVSVGQLAGIPVVLDANVPTNLTTDQDRIICMRRSDQLLFESGSPMMLRFEQTAGANLEYTLLAYCYAAFTSSRYVDSVSVMSGSGLARTL